MVAQLFELAAVVTPALPAVGTQFTALVLRVPEPSPATLITVIAGVGGAVHYCRVAIRHYRSRRHDE